MKVVILAGGLQSTISDIHAGIPKPMAEIGGRPLLWHIMKGFSVQGFNEFVVCGGYKIDLIKEYFMDFYIYESDFTIDLKTNEINIHKRVTENWKVTVVETGIESTPANRVLQAREYIGEDDFMIVHGDCLSNIDYKSLLEEHYNNSFIMTLAVARPSGRNTILPLWDNGELMGNDAAQLPENLSWTDACCKVVSKDIFEYLVEGFPLSNLLYEKLIEEKQIRAYKHHGFWLPVETRRDSELLEAMWKNKSAPWETW